MTLSAVSVNLGHARRASEVTTSIAPVPDKSTKIEEEVEVNMGIGTIIDTTKNFRVEGDTVYSSEINGDLQFIGIYD